MDSKIDTDSLSESKKTSFISFASLCLTVSCFALVVLFLHWYDEGEGFVRSSYYLLRSQEIFQNLVEQPIQNVTKRNDTVVVLLWTSFFSSNTYFWPLSLNCEYNCTFTHDRQLLPNASLVVFHIRDTNSRDLPRNSTAAKAFFSLESPYNTYFSRPGVPYGYFNYSMTYMEDSDIPQGYEYKWEETFNDTSKSIEEIREIISKKKHLALIADSNCNTKSRREDLLIALSSQVNITRVGSCAKRSCDNNCLKKHIASHHFYLAFENSICQDYATEKFFRFTQFIVPVVLKRSVVPKRIPQNVFIAVDDFNNVAEFVHYLKKVASNHTLYERYFDWSINKKVPDNYDEKFDSMCHLCKTAHLLPQKHISDYRQILNVKNQCDERFVYKFLEKSKLKNRK
ncbi:unnamed protein product [Bursaphelenchus okinawaensis]|uniref:Fucosyltransferase n=1 Tax=Bursaphelenchus okinawaensis TaxID=465554 RepID=A0A811K943_9BILA|nr:unnamed protein product [Bursaphelenchus okinawaensis]CAG9096677.1 unnamed protein product [Bursaphelenchus okinawaensis]